MSNAAPIVNATANIQKCIRNKFTVLIFSQQNRVRTHPAVRTRGLWLIPASVFVPRT